MSALFSIINSAGVFFYSSTALSLAGLLVLFTLATRYASSRKPETLTQFDRVARWAFAGGIVNSLLGILHVYRATGYNFALGGFETVFSGIATVMVSMAGTLLVVLTAVLLRAFLPRRKKY